MFQQVILFIIIIILSYIISKLNINVFESFSSDPLSYKMENLLDSDSFKKKSENVCKNKNNCIKKYGHDVYNKCLENDGDELACSCCDYCICIAKSNDRNRCEQDQLFRDCLNSYAHLNDHEASSLCGATSTSTQKACNCYDCNTDIKLDISNSHFICPPKDTCNSKVNKYNCFGQGINPNDKGYCLCSKGIFIDSPSNTDDPHSSKKHILPGMVNKHTHRSKAVSRSKHWSNMPSLRTCDDN